jgi:hypothetical protein
MQKQQFASMPFGRKLSRKEMKDYKGGTGCCNGPIPLYWYCEFIPAGLRSCYVNDPDGCNSDCPGPCTPDMNGCIIA